MTNLIQIGPYEFLNKNHGRRVTLAIMQDNRVSERTFNAKNEVMENKAWRCKDLVDAIKLMEKKVNELTSISQGY